MSGILRPACLAGPSGFYIALHKDTTSDGRIQRPARKRSPLMFVTYILSRIRSYLKYRETLHELSSLSDRDLDDLGISRYDIDAIARKHAA